MNLWLWLPACLVNTDLYERRLDVLSQEPEPGTDTDTDPETGDTLPTGDTGSNDRDGDGFPRPKDCDDTDPTIHPNACEICSDGVDQNCGWGDGICHPQLGSGYVLAEDGQWIDGVSALDNAGLSFASAGDFDGNGLPDVIVGASLADPYDRQRAGSAYLMLSPFPGTLLLADARFDGAAEDDRAGVSVSALDIDLDGLDDLLISAKRRDETAHNQGVIYLVYGRPDPMPLFNDLETVAARWLGEAETETGNLVVALSDVDTLPGGDVAIAAEHTGGQRGAVSVVSGGSSAYLVGESYPLVSIGAGIIGEHPGDRLGSALAGAEDIDGDGLGDILIGAQSASDAGSDAGAALIWTGSPAMLSGAVFSAADAPYRLLGEAPGDHAGSSVASADIDGDGFSDAIIGARSRGSASGAVYVVTDLSSPLTLDLAFADARLLGEEEGARAGQSVAAVGDLDCDDAQDIVIGADGYSSDQGIAYVVFGPVVGDRLLASDPTVLALYGTEGDTDSLGTHVAPLGDLDRDGCDDFGLSAHRYGEEPNEARGRVWIILGTR